MNAKADYKKLREAYEKRRPTTEIKLPSGMVFRAVKPDALELMEVWDILGLKPGELEELDTRALGMRLLTRAREVLDRFVCRFIVEPQLLPSTCKDAKDTLAVMDLVPADRMALINALMAASGGEEGKATAEAFPEPTRK